MLKRVASTVMIVGLSLTAHAGKKEREYMKSDVAPAVTAAEAKFKSACGCALVIAVKIDVKPDDLDSLYQAKYTAESLTNGIGGYCTDAASKKALCAMKTLDIVKAKETTFTFKSGKGVAATDGKTYVNFEQITHELDK